MNILMAKIIGIVVRFIQDFNWGGPQGTHRKTPVSQPNHEGTSRPCRTMIIMMACYALLRVETLTLSIFLRRK